MSEALTLPEAIAQGFKLDDIPDDLRVGYTIRMYRPIKSLPSFDEGLAAWRNRRSIRLREHVLYTLQSQAEVEMVLDHVTL